MILVARTASALEAVDDRIHEAGGSATIAPLDLTDGDSIAKLAFAVAERWEALDIVILNAAMLGSLTPVEHIDPKEYARILGLNLIANQSVIAAFDPLLKKSARADVVALTSSVGSEPRAFWGAYGSSKAALESLLGAYADETQHSGRIRVHIVDPGATRTRMRQLFSGEEPTASNRRRPLPPRLSTPVGRADSEKLRSKPRHESASPLAPVGSVERSVTSAPIAAHGPAPALSPPDHKAESARLAGRYR